MFRDPLMYRIIHTSHQHTGDKWCIYPMYDYAHGECDSIEHVTHSICTLEFDVHRPLYDWFIEHLEIFPSHQYEFARLNLTYTLMMGWNAVLLFVVVVAGLEALVEALFEDAFEGVVCAVVVELLGLQWVLGNVVVFPAVVDYVDGFVNR